MELRHLKYFIAVAETGSLTEAAESRLHTSQPSLSRQIRDLEDHVGTPLFSRSARGVELTHAGKVFLEQSRLALAQVEAAVQAARKAGEPGKQRFSLGFLTGQEMTWLPEAMHILREELPHIEVTVFSDYSPDLAEAVARGKIDLAFLRAEPNAGLEYRTVAEEPIVVLMPSDHRLTAQDAVRPEQLVGEPFIAMAGRAVVLRSVIEQYLHASGVVIDVTQRVDNPAMVMSLVASTRGLSLIPSYVENLMPWSVTSRPLAGEVPMIALAVGYRKNNASPILQLFLSRIDELIARVARRTARPPAP